MFLIETCFYFHRELETLMSTKLMVLRIALVIILRGQVRVFVVEGICKLVLTRETVFFANSLHLLPVGIS